MHGACKATEEWKNDARKAWSTEQGLGYDGLCSLHSKQTDCDQQECEWVADGQALEQENYELQSRLFQLQEYCGFCSGICNECRSRLAEGSAPYDGSAPYRYADQDSCKEYCCPYDDPTDDLATCCSAT